MGAAGVVMTAHRGQFLLEAATLLAGKTIFVTGAGGYLAYALTQALSQAECAIRRLSRARDRLSLLSGPAQVRDLVGDPTLPGDWEAWLEGVDVVFHLAAQTSLKVAAADPLMDLRANVFPLLHMLTTCQKRDYRPTIVIAGTATEIGLSKSLPVGEEHYEQPVTVYDLHKLMADKYLLCYALSGLARGCVLRLANVYGPGPLSASADRGILNLMIGKALAGRELTIFGQGEFIRDFIFIDDVVEAFLLAAAHGDRCNGHHFVLGTGQGHSMAQALGLVAELAQIRTGRLVDLLHVQPSVDLSPIEERNFVANHSLFSELTGWQPRHSLRQGLQRTMDFFQMIRG